MTYQSYLLKLTDQYHDIHSECSQLKDLLEHMTTVVDLIKRINANVQRFEKEGYDTRELRLLGYMFYRLKDNIIWATARGVFVVDYIEMVEDNDYIDEHGFGEDGDDYEGNWQRVK